MTASAPSFTRTPLFTVTPLPLVRVGLRRYQGLAGGWRCGPNARHEATTWLLAPLEQAIDDHRRLFEPGPATVPIDGTLWPTSCAQGKNCTNEPVGQPVQFPITRAYALGPSDHAVVIHERLARREDTGEQALAYAPPVGGVVHLDYLDHLLRGADGRCLGIATPDGLWYLDVTGRAGERFTRTGEGAALTVVQTAGPPWRWRVTDGLLEEDLARGR